MLIVDFDVDATSVRDFFFPHLQPFDANSSPSSTTVALMIAEEAASLDGQLLLQGLSAASIYALTDTSSAFVWCAKTLRLMLAVVIARAMTGLNPEVVKTWKDEVDARLADLAQYGQIALGLSSSSNTAPRGPTTYIDALGLEPPDAADASSLTPVLRRDDLL